MPPDYHTLVRDSPYADAARGCRRPALAAGGTATFSAAAPPERCDRDLHPAGRTAYITAAAARLGTSCAVPRITHQATMKVRPDAAVRVRRSECPLATVAGTAVRSSAGTERRGTRSLNSTAGSDVQ